MEQLLLALKLSADSAGLRCTVLGAWPSRLHCLLQLPSRAAAAAFLACTLPELLSCCGFALQDFAALLPLRWEPNLQWDRAAALPRQQLSGFLRVYAPLPASAARDLPSGCPAEAQFQAVLQGLQSFLGRCQGAEGAEGTGGGAPCK